MKKTPSERIFLIQDIAKRFKDEEWQIIDLTLRQFNLPTTESWSSSDKQGYIINMIDKADDESLAQLHFHLSGEKSLSYPSGTLEFWQPGTYRIFLSHVSKHKIEAADLKRNLNEFHISTFVAHTDIEPTKEWQDEIELALESADCLLALVTEDFHKSNWTDQELGIAIGKGKMIVAVSCGGKPYGFLQKYQWLKSPSLDTDLIKEELFTILSMNNLSKKKFSEALVNKFESSHSFVSAMANMSLLEKVDYLDSDLLKRVQMAHDNNSQINGAYGVTYRVQQLINKAGIS